eukprot:14962528-Alexandrium_andersonii.AAC.1
MLGQLRSSCWKLLESAGSFWKLLETLGSGVCPLSLALCSCPTNYEKAFWSVRCAGTTASSGWV